MLFGLAFDEIVGRFDFDVGLLSTSEGMTAIFHHKYFFFILF